jgi:hypothetical protein
MFNKFLFSDYRDVCEVTCKTNTVQPDRPRVTIWRMRIAFWIPEATKHTQNM